MFVLEDDEPLLLLNRSETEKLLPVPAPPSRNPPAKNRMSTMKTPRIQPFRSRIVMSMALGS